MSVGMRALMVCALAVTLHIQASGRASAEERKSGLTVAGDILAIAIPTGAGVLSLAYGDHDGVWMNGANVLATAVAVNGLKAATKDTSWSIRPNGLDYGFPSGHASYAFSGAAFLHYRYGWQYGLPAAALASVVAYSRIENKYHHWRDVIVGAAIPYVTGYFLVDHYNENVRILPFVDWSRKPTFGIVVSIKTSVERSVGSPFKSEPAFRYQPGPPMGPIY
jgi:membrane-associated phospholipid phosphatase